MISKNLYLMFRTVEIYFLFSTCFNYREKFLIMYFVVKLR
jgi:hypothetical protein